MNPHQPLVDQLYREEVLHARKQTPQQRLRATFEVTELALGMMRDSIRNKHPEADAAELTRLGRERIGKVRRMRDWKIYRSVEAPQ